MQNSITHSGVVVSVSGNCAVVRIEQLSACAGCHAASMLPEGVKAAPGDVVKIKSKRENKHAAIVLAYILPLCIMVAVLFLSVLAIGLSEAAGALVSVIFLAAYFVILWLLRDKLKRRFVFYVQPY